MSVVKKRDKIIPHIVLGLGCLIMIYPLAFAFLGSFLSLEEFYGVTFLPIPTHLGSFFKNIAVLFKRSEFINSIGITMLRVLWYSFIVGATSVFGGYVFAKVNFKGKKIAFYVLMSSMMVPGVALLIPQYMMLARFPLVGGNDIFGKGGFGFINNASVLFVTGCFSAYNIFLLRQGFSSLADDFKEAAEVDGASFFTVVFRIYLPMVKPMLAVIFISLFIGQWNDYFFPFIFVSGNPAALPVGVASVRISDDYLYASGISGAGLVNYPVVMACAVVMMLPPMAVFITFQRYFIAGMTLGGVKS